MEDAYGMKLRQAGPARVRRVTRGGWRPVKAGVRINDAVGTIGGINVRSAATDFVYALLSALSGRVC